MKPTDIKAQAKQLVEHLLEDDPAQEFAGMPIPAATAPADPAPEAEEQDDEAWREAAEKAGAIIYTLPVYWASYLINGDDSGLEEGEEQQIQDFLKKEGDPYIVDVGPGSWFAHSNDATDMGGDVAYYSAWPKGHRLNP